MPDVTIGFIARSDFESKPGGDTIQWQMYDRAARAAGLKTTTWLDDAPVPRADVFHAFNVDRPLELYPKLVEVKKRGIPFVLSTIHHPYEWLGRFRRFQPPTGLFGKLLYRSVIGRSVPASEAIREAALLVLHRRLAHVGDLVPSWTRRVRWLLANADRIVLLTSQEGAYVQQDFGCRFQPEQPLILPNWVEGLDECSSAKPGLFSDHPEAPVIVVGRIEPRKNSLRVCRLAEAARRPLVFIGPPHPNERVFVDAFKQTVGGSAYARWVPGVSRAEMGQFYSHAGFLLNASLVEVSPLVDIEALAFGCPVATTRYAVHQEILPPQTPRVDPYDDQDILRRLGWRPERLIPRHLVDPEKCKRDLVHTYLSLTHVRPFGLAKGNPLRGAP